MWLDRRIGYNAPYRFNRQGRGLFCESVAGAVRRIKRLVNQESSQEFTRFRM
jgi:hypothetical protein